MAAADAQNLRRIPPSPWIMYLLPRTKRPRTRIAFGLSIIILWTFSFVSPDRFSATFDISGPIGISSSGNSAQVAFVTFAFTVDAGGRWRTDDCKSALRLTYSSLANSQTLFPQMHVYTDDPTVIPSFTTSGMKTDIVIHQSSPSRFPSNSYTGKDEWLSLSRAKIDLVEMLIRETGQQIIWIDLDTLVFVDLSLLSTTHSWVVGYQHGNCHNCSADHISRSGALDVPIDAKHDVHGDLWSLNLTAIKSFRL